MTDINKHASFIWSVADLLRGDYMQSEYSKIILPLTVLRRLDCAIDPVKDDMLANYGEVKDSVANVGTILDRLTAIKGLWNTSKFDMAKLLDDPTQISENLRAYIAGFRSTRRHAAYRSRSGRSDLSAGTGLAQA